MLVVGSCNGCDYSGDEQDYCSERHGSNQPISTIIRQVLLLVLRLGGFQRRKFSTAQANSA
jgi:hypothetical protein